MALYDCCMDGWGWPGGQCGDQASVRQCLGGSNCHRKWSLLPPAPPGALSSSSRHPPSCGSGDPKPVESYDTEGLREINSFHYSRFISLALSFGSLAGILAIVKLTEAQLPTKAA